MSASGVVVRPPAVAGTFYPDDPAALRAELHRCLAGATPPAPGEPTPEAIVVPHAGYLYSGPVAASAYRLLEGARTTIRRVVLLGPAHRVPLRGIASSSADAWVTPLGSVPLDNDAAAALARVGPVGVSDVAHAPEHSLEVQLPFLQTVLDDFTLLPLVVGAATTEEVATVVDAVWDDPGTLVVVSTDLSHYHPYEVARRLDEATATAVTALDPGAITDDAACGARPLRGLLRAARRRGRSIRRLDLRNSGDTAGDHHRVVGYGAFSVN